MKSFSRLSLLGLLAFGTSLLVSSAQSIYLNAGVIDTLATTASNAMSVLNFAEALQSSNAPEVAVN